MMAANSDFDWQARPPENEDSFDLLADEDNWNLRDDAAAIVCHWEKQFCDQTLHRIDGVERLGRMLLKERYDAWAREVPNLTETRSPSSTP